MSKETDIITENATKRVELIYATCDRLYAATERAIEDAAGPPEAGEIATCVVALISIGLICLTDIACAQRKLTSRD